MPLRAITPARRAIVAGVAVSVTFSSIFIYRASFLVDGRRYFTLFDDAMVSMRYGRSLTEGHGLVWNAGQPPVEGYTNFLWTLWMAALHMLPLPDRLTSLVVSATGALLLMLCVIFTVRLVVRLTPDRRDVATIAGALAVALCYPLVFWTLRGMEVGLLAALIVVGVDLAFGIAANERGRFTRLGAVLVLLTLTRPDGIVPAMAIGGWTLWQAACDRRRAALVVCAAPMLALAAHAAFRWFYYGALLPNTYYLKMTGVPLAVRLGRGIVTSAHELLVVAAPLAFAVAGRRPWRPQIVLLLGLPLGLLAYSVYVGGDAWEWMPIANRYVTPGLPLLIAAAAAAIGAAPAAERRGHRRAVLLTSAAAVLLVAGPSYAGIRDWIRTGGSHVQDDALMTELAIDVKESTSERTSVGVVWAGILPYFSRRPAVDFLGKSDPVIAKHAPVLPFMPGHDRFDYDYSIGKLRPDLVIQLWSPTPHALQLLADLDYQQVVGSVYARRGAPIDVDRLRASLRMVPSNLAARP